MKSWGPTAGLLILLNFGLALAVHLAAPDAPRHSDRQAYEWVGAHAFEPDCGWSIYCYRVAVPLLLEQIPLDAERRWRWYQLTSVTTAGALIAIVSAQFAGGASAAVLASILVQAGYGFAFTAYDPYTADPLVFVVAALIAWCWCADRWRLALAAALAGIFVKETVALVSAACLLAALARDRTTWRAWVISSALVGMALLAFRFVMDTYYGWGVSANPAADLSSGSWLAIWWENNPFLIRKIYMLFSAFGFAWLFAAVGWSRASPALRQLAAGAVLPFLALCYVQTPERALANAFFVVVPMAAGVLARAPFVLAVAAAVANGLVTAKIGTSTEWLPSSGILMIPATVLAGSVVYLSARAARPASASPREATDT